MEHDLIPTDPIPNPPNPILPEISKYLFDISQYILLPLYSFVLSISINRLMKNNQPR